METRGCEYHPKNENCSEQLLTGETREFMQMFHQRLAFPLCGGRWLFACRLQSSGEPVRCDSRASRWKDLTFFPPRRIRLSGFVFTAATKGNLYDFLSLLICFPVLSVRVTVTDMKVRQLILYPVEGSQKMACPEARMSFICRHCSRGCLSAACL